MSKTIPCSVSILTFNSAAGLSACLEALKEFKEIVICDGNSTDATRDVAARYGAKVIKQYDTDEPLTPCAMDKAAVRQRAMDASTLPWRFFMDSDDTLSQGAVEEIRTIVTAPQPGALVWRMPTRIFVAGKEIKHEATYPAYQTRLVHESVGARFKNPVHDRLVWDEKRYPVGTMRTFYNFGWPQERVANYWRYLGAYAKREVQTQEFASAGQLFWWSLKRIKTIVGYLLWRLPTMYLRHGFADSMPLSIELTIVRYHYAVLFGSIAKHVRTRPWVVLVVETLRGKDLNRVLSNLAVRRFEAYGRVLDVGGGHSPSYWRYLVTRRWMRKTTLDIDPRVQPDITLNLEQEPLPHADGHFDTVLMFNVLEHLNSRSKVVAEVRRVLRPGGEFLGVVPFLVAVHPDPSDYVRLTRQGLEELFASAGFTEIEIMPVGRGPFVASYYQSEFIYPRVLKLLQTPCVLLFDRLVLALRPGWREKFPLSYTFRVR
jgi:glycosyltransferase involved in cell wall biosynthesis